MKTELPLSAIRFNALIAELCRLIDKHGRTHRIEEPVLLLIWNRVTRMARLFANIAVRVRAEMLAKVAPPRSRDAAPRHAGAADPQPARPPRARPADELPRYFRWLVNSIPETEAVGSSLCWLLHLPEIVELIDEAPQVCRVLRPLCRMLGVELPSALWVRRRVHVQAPTEPDVTEPDVTEPGVPEPDVPEPDVTEPADDPGWTQWREPGLPGETEAELGEFQPPPKKRV